MNDIYIMP